MRLVELRSAHVRDVDRIAALSRQKQKIDDVNDLSRQISDASILDRGSAVIAPSSVQEKTSKSAWRR